jgi:hypothetical protein
MLKKDEQVNKKQKYFIDKDSDGCFHHV